MLEPETSVPERWLARACVTLPLVLLAANLVAWLRYGTDMPFIDDWRAYRDGSADSFALSRLFQTVNNTISPVGFALDTAAQRWLDGNSIAYQFLSMLSVLGSLLWLQWRLTGWAIENSVARVAAFAATVFMLQAGSYWGEQNLAYHQALPLVFLLGVATVVLTSPFNNRLTGALAFVLSLLAGFSYISGAIAALTLGLVWIAMSSVAGPDHALPIRVRVGGFASALAGLLTTGVQIYLTRIAPGGDPALRYDLTWPDKPEFWLFLVGKIGRATGHAMSPAGLEFAIALGVAVLFLTSFLTLLWWFVNTAGRGMGSRIAYIYIPLCLMVAGYLLLVALGRTSVRDPAIGKGWAVFQFAYFRFHFFWVTLLLPWLLAAAALLSPGAPIARERVVRRALVMLAVMLAFAAARGVFGVNEHYAENARFRAKEIVCMAEQLGSGNPIQCPSFDMPDWTPAYQYARGIQASFIKYFPVVAQHPSHDWLMRWASTGGDMADNVITMHDARELPGHWWIGGDDPQVIFRGHDAQGFANCLIVELDVSIRSRREEPLQVFFLKRGEVDFTEQNSLIRKIPATLDEAYQVRFTLNSGAGFESRIRIDPGRAGAQFEITRIDAGCRLRKSSNE